MNDKEAEKLRIWIEDHYGEKTSVQICDRHSILLDKSYISMKGVNIHTDGIIEKNDKDGFGKVIISGFNYLMICLFGKEFSDIEDPRITIYCNGNSSFSYRKYRKAIAGVLDNY